MEQIRKTFTGLDYAKWKSDVNIKEPVISFEGLQTIAIWQHEDPKTHSAGIEIPLEVLNNSIRHLISITDHIEDENLLHDIWNDLKALTGLYDSISTLG
jgi:hypothetical protein